MRWHASSAAEPQLAAAAAAREVCSPSGLARIATPMTLIAAQPLREPPPREPMLGGALQRSDGPADRCTGAAGIAAPLNAKRQRPGPILCLFGNDRLQVATGGLYLQGLQGGIESQQRKQAGSRLLSRPIPSWATALHPVLRQCAPPATGNRCSRGHGLPDQQNHSTGCATRTGYWTGLRQGSGGFAFRMRQHSAEEQQAQPPHSSPKPASS